MKMLTIFVSATLVAVSASADGLVGVGEGEQGSLPAGELGSANYVVDGQLRKATAGELVLERARLAGSGEVLVSQGTLRLTSAGGPADTTWKPQDVLAKAAVWIDVSDAETVQLVEGSDGNVLQILDVREPDRTIRTAVGAYSYPHWMAHTNIAHSARVTELGPDHWFPTYHAAAGEVRAHVDFGGYQSGQSLKMYDKKGNTAYIANVRHVFVVAGTFDYKWGFLLDGGGANTVYVPECYSRADFSISAYYCWVNNGDRQQQLRTGRFRVDNAIVDPFTTKITEGYHLLDMPILPQNRLSGFFNGADVASDANQYRQGGGRLCEAIAFTSELTESERSLVAHYLTRKWLGMNTARLAFKVADGASAFAEYDVAAGQRAELGESGGIAIEKNGDGTLVGPPLVGTESAQPVVLKLNAGAVDAAHQMVLERAEARIYSVADGVLSAGSAGSDTLVKTGDGDLSVASLDPAVRKIRVEGGTLRLSRVEAASVGTPAGSLEGVIEDPSFEAFDEFAIGENVASGKRLSNTTAIHGWLATAAANFPHVVKWYRSATNNYYYCRNDIPFPDGLHALVIDYGGAKTTLTLPRAGVYRLSFWAAPRPNYSGGEFRVSIDGGDLIQVMTANADNKYVRHEIRTPYLTAGAHTLVFQADPYNNKGVRGEEILTGNKVCMIDDVRVDWLSDDDPGGTVSNGDFELNGFQYKMLVATNSVSGWTVGGTDADSRVRLISDGTAASSARYASIDGLAKLSGTLRFQAAGSYWLLFKMRQPVAAANAFKALGVTVGEQGVAVNARVLNTVFGSWEELRVGPFAIAEDQVGVDVPVAFAGTAAGAPISVDDIRVVRDDLLTKTVTDSFASAGWTVDDTDPGLPGVSDSSAKVEFQAVDVASTSASSLVKTWGPLTYDDKYRVGIRNRGTIYRSVNLPSAGTYRVSVVAMGRFWRYEDQHLDNPSILRAFGGQSFAVWLGTADGTVTNRLGEFTVDGVERWTRHSFYATVTAAGTYRIGFTGLKLSNGEYDGKMRSHGGMLDGLVIEPVALRETAIPLAAPLEIEVRPGAKLGLDDGVQLRPVDRLLLGGRPYSGVCDADTEGGYLIGTGSLEVRRHGIVIIFN